ncbi:MAG: hypothetical protein VX628_05445, partial [Cyanobacteriota bacterium]|nr:hypothetical protein [Cyanobacteriota bacterium]
MILIRIERIDRSKPARINQKGFLNQRFRMKGALVEYVNRSVVRLSVVVQTVLSVDPSRLSNGANCRRGYICCAWLSRRRLPSAASGVAANFATHAYGSMSEQ